jgi:PAS domain S-box-containing protein
MILLAVHVNWEKILGVIAGVILLNQFLKEVFGISVIGKKIYKGAPMVWKWIMRSSIHRKEMDNKLDILIQDMKHVKVQVEYNGGSSMKDAVRRIEQKVDYNVMRMNIMDMCSDRMTFKMDKNGSCTFINDSFLKCFGYAENDILEFSFENIIHEDDVPGIRLKWQRAIDKKSRFYDEQRIYDVHGTEFKVIVRAYPVIEDNGNLKEFYGTIDIINEN